MQKKKPKSIFYSITLKCCSIQMDDNWKTQNFMLLIFLGLKIGQRK